MKKQNPQAAQPRSPSPQRATVHEIELLESIRRIIRGYDIHSRRLLATTDVTLAQLLCLRTLVEFGPCTSKQLAENIHISASAMVGILDRLEAKKLIARQRDGKDRRRVFVTITRSGRTLLRKSPPPLGEDLQRHFSQLHLAKQASLSAALRLVADFIEPDSLGRG